MLVKYRLIEGLLCSLFIQHVDLTRINGIDHQSRCSSTDLNTPSSNSCSKSTTRFWNNLKPKYDSHSQKEFCQALRLLEEEHWMAKGILTCVGTSYSSLRMASTTEPSKACWAYRLPDGWVWACLSSMFGHEIILWPDLWWVLCDKTFFWASDSKDKGNGLCPKW